MQPVRVSTIVWGVLLLLLASAAFAVTTLDVELFTGSVIAYVVVGLGSLFVVAAIIGAVARGVKPAPVLVEPALRVEPVETTDPRVEPVVTPDEPTARRASPSPTRTTAKPRTKNQPVD